MDHSTPGFPVHHQLQKLAQTHVHQVGDAIQPPHSLLSPSPPAFNLSQHQGLLQWVFSLYAVFQTNWFSLLALVDAGDVLPKVPSVPIPQLLKVLVTQSVVFPWRITLALTGALSLKATCSSCQVNLEPVTDRWEGTRAQPLCHKAGQTCGARCAPEHLLESC